MKVISDANSTIYFEAVEKFIDSDFESCIDDFLQLSAAGDARATLYAATIYDRGDNTIKQNWRRARELYKLSLSQSYLPGAALGLALMMYKGRGGAEDFSEAIKYFRMLRNNAFSKIMLGLMNLNGNGCTKNQGAALQFFEEAWKLGHPVGLKNAAIIRFQKGEYIRSSYDYLRSAVLIFWIYGVKKQPWIRSPRDHVSTLC